MKKNTRRKKNARHGHTRVCRRLFFFRRRLQIK